MNLLSWIKGLWKPKKERVIVFFDGDQPHQLNEFTNLYRPLDHVEYLWIQNARANVTLRVRNSGIKIVRPSDVGKESVDTYIAMRIVYECLSRNPPSRVIIISRDMDFVDVIVNASRWFTDVDFSLLVQVSKQFRPKLDVELPKNARIQFFRSK